MGAAGCCVGWSGGELVIGAGDGAPGGWRAWDTAVPLRCAEVRLCFLSPCVGFLKGFVERPTFTVSQSWPALPPKLDIVAFAVCSVWLLVSVISCGVRINAALRDSAVMHCIEQKAEALVLNGASETGVSRLDDCACRPLCADRQAVHEPTKTPPEGCSTCCCTLERLSSRN